MLEEVLASMEPEELEEQGGDSLAVDPQGNEQRCNFKPASLWIRCANLMFLEFDICVVCFGFSHIVSIKADDKYLVLRAGALQFPSVVAEFRPWCLNR